MSLSKGSVFYAGECSGPGRLNAFNPRVNGTFTGKVKFSSGIAERKLITDDGADTCQSEFRRVISSFPYQRVNGGLLPC